MFDPKQILVPTDFSPSAWKALEDAAAIADTWGAWLDLLYVWEFPSLAVPAELGGYGIPSPAIEKASAEAQCLMEELLCEARAKGFAIRHAKAMPGNPHRMIVEAAKAGSYDLIVIGSHGRRGLARVMLGSVAEQVVRHAPCPVLVAAVKLEETAEALAHAHS
jgi:universal stress protein A